MHLLMHAVPFASLTLRPVVVASSATEARVIYVFHAIQSAHALIKRLTHYFLVNPYFVTLLRSWEPMYDHGESNYVRPGQHACKAWDTIH